MAEEPRTQQQQDPLADPAGRRAGDQPDSMSSILEAQQSQQAAGAEGDDDPGGMTGHPALDALTEGEERAEDAEAPEAESEPEPAPPPADETETQEPRFQSQDDAERAHAEAERRMHLATEEAALTRRELDLIKQELAQFRAERQQQAQPPQEREPEPPPPTFNVEDHWRQTFRRLNNLDPEADDYDEQRVGIMAQAQREASEQLQREQEARVLQRVQRENEQTLTRFQQETTERAQAEANQQRLRQKIIDRAAAAGLDVSPPNPEAPNPENRLGGIHFRDAQAVIDEGLYSSAADEDTAIQEVIDVVAKRFGITPPPPQDSGTPPAQGTAGAVNGRQQPAEASRHPPDATRRAQARNTPMERAGSGRATPAPREEDSRPLSMEEILSRVNEPRIVRR